MISIIQSTRLSSRGIPAFFHSPPASECLLFAWPLRRRSGANSAAGPQGGGQEARSKEKAPRERPPHTRALRTVPVLQVREPATGFADSPSLDWRRTGPHRVGHPSDIPSAVSPRSRGPASAHRARQSQSGNQKPPRNYSCVVLHRDVRMSRAQDALERPLPPASMQSSSALSGTFARRAGEENARAKPWRARACFVLAAQDAQ